MTKVIENIELLKKLQPHLWKTEYYIDIKTKSVEKYFFNDTFYPKDLKTLTLEEAIELIHKNKISLEITTWTIDEKNKLIYSINTNIENKKFLWYKLIEQIEKMIEYLIDNNLLKDE